MKNFIHLWFWKLVTDKNKLIIVIERQRILNLMQKNYQLLMRTFTKGSGIVSCVGWCFRHLDLLILGVLILVYLLGFELFRFESPFLWHDWFPLWINCQAFKIKIHCVFLIFSVNFWLLLNQLLLSYFLVRLLRLILSWRELFVFVNNFSNETTKVLSHRIERFHHGLLLVLDSSRGLWYLVSWFLVFFWNATLSWVSSRFSFRA